MRELLTARNIVLALKFKSHIDNLKKIHSIKVLTKNEFTKTVLKCSIGYFFAFFRKTIFITLKYMEFPP